MVQISVVIPVYNCERYLNDAVASVLNQPYDAIDIVLVDDGSTDHSPELCDALAKAHANISVIHQENAGVSAARNRGISHVLSRKTNIPPPCTFIEGYIAFLDADDMWTKDFFTEDSVSELPDAQIIVNQSRNCNCTLERGRSPSPMEEGIYPGGSKTVRRCLSQHFAAALYSCRLLEEHGIRFVEGLRYSEDSLFFKLCVSAAASVALCNKPLYMYRNTPISAMHNANFGTAYFEPIFIAYLAEDSDGKGYVGWYLVDMIESHFRHFGRISTLREWMEGHENYIEIAQEFGGERANSVLSALQNHPRRYALRNYVIGAVTLIIRKVIRAPGISKIVERMRYPIKLH